MSEENNLTEASTAPETDPLRCPLCGERCLNKTSLGAHKRRHKVNAHRGSRGEHWERWKKIS